MSYTFSKDYELLYELVCKGYEIYCLVDYDIHRTGKDIARDACRCRRLESYHIQFIVRAMEYGGIYPFEKDKGSEKDLFIENCKISNVEFAIPYNEEFIHWAAYNYIRLTGLWCHKYVAQIPDNFITTEDLFKFWLNPATT
jgi:hypothetical protein